ncbi:hypothetical protein EMPG_14756 [Blastomyces silverae]|uniref:Uncharacterized protein n=1 Tax=Blastomyces silverae TaxID=2060906 RepID=A0A0H1BEF8_9EURO|nr:hypothetical protein EMPG_14756 [Blastomyces silverae]
MRRRRCSCSRSGRMRRVPVRFLVVCVESPLAAGLRTILDERPRRGLNLWS